MEENKTKTEKPEIKKEDKTPLKDSKVEVVSSPQPQQHQPEVSIKDITKLYDVIKEQNKNIEEHNKRVEELLKEKKQKVETKVERSTNIVENSDKEEDKLDNSKIFNGVFVS